MRTPIVPIGNSKGIRIPKAVLDQCNISKEVALEIRNGRIILEPVKSNRKNVRKGWEKSFMRMADLGEDKLLIDDSLDLDDGEWQW